MIVSNILLLMVMLQVKHLIVDWLYQPKYEWSNKGTYGHWGGVRHALKNALGTAGCFYVFVSPTSALIVLLIDFVIHYHIDWAKMNINQAQGWGPLTHEEFWWLTGTDQFLHQITYLFLIWLVL